MSYYIDNLKAGDDFSPTFMPELTEIEAEHLRAAFQASYTAGVLIKLHRALTAEIACNSIDVSPNTMDHLLQAAGMLASIGAEQTFDHGRELNKQRVADRQAEAMSSQLRSTEAGQQLVEVFKKSEVAA